MTAPARKLLPIGIQTFSKIRESDFYYVDKTALALQLIRLGSCYFLSRPRRFGKSLFLDTLRAIFEGEEEHFRGLTIHDQWDWAVKYPVIRLSFGDGVMRDRNDLDRNIEDWLITVASDFGHTYATVTRRKRFGEIIRVAHEKTGQRVVILVDEYDKPILDRIEQPDLAADIREGLRDFYSAIKDSDAHVRFVFITGVTKFSKVSLFSGLNNLKDITIDPRYSAICGYTDEDVETVFAPELDGLDREEIRRWYNGYNWTGQAVFNPYDLLLLFDTRKFGPYWFETGTPTFLVKLLADRKADVPEIGRMHASADLLSTFDVGNIPTEALMFQAGYLTLGTPEILGDEEHFPLRYPNHEVKKSLIRFLLRELTGDASIPARNGYTLLRLLQDDNIAGLRDLFHAFFASIPADWYRKNQLAGYEGYYAGIFYSYFVGSGLDVVVEDSTNHGRIDMAVRLAKRTLLLEFKVVEMVPEGKAIEQLERKGYAEKYRSPDRPMTLIGVEFSRDSRNIVAFDVRE